MNNVNRFLFRFQWLTNQDFILNDGCIEESEENLKQNLRCAWLSTDGYHRSNMGLTIGCPSLGGKILFMRARWLCGISHNDSLFITHPWQSLFLWRIVNFINKKISLSLRLCIFFKLLSKESERQTWDIWFQTSPFIESKFFQIHFFAVKLIRTSNFGLTSIS